MKIGAYMIVKNEESCLGTCLESLKGFDEITILDTGSTDNTFEVANKFKCNFMFGLYKWADNFAEARNECMKYAKADWLVVIDADEVFVGSVDGIRKSIDKYPKAKSFKVNTVSLKSKEAHYSVRLHRNLDEIKWNGAIHNHLSALGDETLEGAEVHYGYSAAHAQDPDRALRILTKVVKETPNCAREKYYLAREFWYRRDYKMALYYYDYYFENATFGPEMADAHIMKARCHHAMGNLDLARDECLQAVKLNGNFKEAWRLLASLMGPGNKIRFNAIADTANNEGVLFKRGK